MQIHRTFQRSKMGPLFVAGLVLLAIGGGLVYSDAEAVPAFARKYDISCNACHTRQPRLNPYGQRFMENGYQLPGTSDGGKTEKHLLGSPLDGVTLDDISNYMAVRLRGDVEKANYRDSDATETTDDWDIVFPDVINLFFAGTVTEDISFFMEAEYATREGDGESSLGFERVYMVFDNLGGQQVANIKIGDFDPSSFYAFPTHRQQLNPVPVEAETNDFPPTIDRIPLLPLAFSSKMYGLTQGESFEGKEDFSILPFEPFLYNAPVQTGVSVHGRPFGSSFLYQVGIVQNDDAKTSSETRWDKYVTLRYDLLYGEYSAFQVSGFYYTAPDAAMPTLNMGGTLVYADKTVDWDRYGIGARWTSKWWDVYGTVVWDDIDKPKFAGVGSTSTWETSASGISVEADYLLNAKWLLGVRYDSMSAGGLEKGMPGWDESLNQDASFIGLLAKYYPTPNIGLYARYHQNLESSANMPAALGGEETPATNFKSMALVGVDMAF
ncbi:MAG: hypothetical protein BMS9Abin08_0741 [Gammaproteobacteria bacterium]|nr:MAG: hypothetical protein BMS9Abin08_0741 [Gammaproteobacteria bacterium]